MVIARALVQALRGEGHHADVIVTPQNRFGRQAAAYAATWLTDVGMSDGQPIDRVISLRYPSYAVRHPHHVCWLNHTMREYYDLWPRLSSGLGRLGLAKERVRRRLTHAADRYLLTRNVANAVRAVADGAATAGDVARTAQHGAVSAAAAARIPLRRLRRLRLHGVAPDAAQACRPAAPGAGDRRRARASAL